MTDTLSVSVDATDALLVLRNGAKRQAYAIANALNQTAKLIQARERASLFGKLTVRRRDFILRQIAIIKPFASAKQGLMEVKISVGQKSRLLLGQLEQGGVRTPFKGRNVAIPVIGGARPSQASQVDESLYVQALNIHRDMKRLVGEHGTYLVPGKGIYQDVPGTDRGRLLYAFKPTVQIKPTLKWMPQAIAIAVIESPRLLAKQVEETFTRHFVADLFAGASELD